jgi:hypothetical protein
MGMSAPWMLHVVPVLWESTEVRAHVEGTGFLGVPCCAPVLGLQGPLVGQENEV